MSDIALYHPYVNFRDEAWLKAAVLYWPKIGRMCPEGYYDMRDSDTVKQLNDELGCIVDIRPGMCRLPDGGWHTSEEKVEKVFYDFLGRHREDLLPRFGVRALGIDVPMSGTTSDELLPLDPRVEEVHPGKMSWQLANRLADEGLLVRLEHLWVRPSDGQLLSVHKLAMHRSLAYVYLAALADAIARDNGMSTITDLPIGLAASSGWTVETLASVLLDDSPVVETTHGDLAQAFAVIALQAAVPRGLRAVPVSRIIEARRQLQPELLAYREYLDSLATVFAELSEVPDPEVRSAKFCLAVEREILRRLERTERQMSRLGLEPIRALLSLQSLAPPAVLALLGKTMDLPPVVTGTGVVAGTVVAATAASIGRREEIRQAHPTGYLLGLKRELGPSDAVAAVRTAFRRASRRRSIRPS